ncbi:MAG: hypothetical protein Q7S02_00120, partial [bacterium]|nr:hypothetical protein [bacterium]
MAISIVALLFAAGTSILSYDNARTADLAPRFHWPDETTNHFFTSRVARNEPLAVSEPRNIPAGNVIHPRTANVRADGAIVPGSYLGLPLWYGLIGRMFGERAMLFVTPFLAALGLLAFASIARRLAGATVAMTATVILALHPALWLFTATALLPNVPFVTLLMVAIAVLLHAPRGWSIIIAGLFVGLALTIRTHELLWVFAIIGTLAWKLRFGLRQLLVLAIGIAIPFIPILILNAQLYGSPFTTGYALLQDGGAAPTEFAASRFPDWIAAFVAPFGWHPIDAFARFWQYMVVPYWWFIALAVVGMGVVYTRRNSTPPSPPSQREVGKQKSISPLPRGRGSERGWAIATLALIAWLVLYYGSWTIADPLVRETNVLTISYVRYWIP